MEIWRCWIFIRRLDFQYDGCSYSKIKSRCSFYGCQPCTEETAQINAPLLVQYASLDTRVNSGWEAYEKALKENNKEYQVHFYEGVNHGFHNNTTPRFNKEAADLAWKRTIEFFKEKLI